jgi:DNA-binding transcriptional MerR regulator
MRISELSRRTGVSVASIKYYLREGLLAPGESAGATNQADYDESHVHRLHLIRTLLTVGGLSVAAVRDTVHALDAPDVDRHLLLAVAHTALPTPAGGAREQPTPDVLQARTDVAAFLDELSWPSAADAPARLMLADALVALRRLGRDVEADVFAPYARAADELADAELASMPTDSPPERMVEDAVIGTVVFESALVALRRLAHGKHSADRFGPGSHSDWPTN